MEAISARLERTFETSLFGIPDALGLERLTEIAAEIWVEAPSQRGILIGKEGFRIQEIGTDSRKLNRVSG